MIGLARSTYYYSPAVDEAKAREDADIRDRMEQLALKFPRYGYRRMTRQLRREKWKNVNHKRVLRIMRESDLLVQRRRRFVHTTDSNHSLPVFPNLLAEFKPTGLDQVWVSDITYIRIRTGFAFLATILDAFSRKVVGWALSRGITAEIVYAALESAWSSRRPAPGLIFHSDRGSQYCSGMVIGLARDTYGMEISMSRKGNPYDNAIAESFFKTLKDEEIYLMDVPTYEELGRRLPEYIDRIYNTERLHSALGYLPPVEFEAMARGNKPAGDVITTGASCPA
jgi:putative transposase